MTATQDTDQRFAWIAQHGGPVVNWAEPSGTRRHLVEGEGLSEWSASDSDVYDNKALRLSKHVEDANGTRMLELRLARNAAPGADPVHWDSTLKVGDGRYVRLHGSAADFTKALEKVEAHVPENRQLGGLTWWCESQDRWVSWLGAFILSATKIGRTRDEPYWHFEVRGDAPTLEEAALLAMMGRLDMNGGQGA